MMDLLSLPIVIGIAIVVSLTMAAVIVVTLRRSRMRKVLGLPPDSRLRDRHKRMFHACEDTDVWLNNGMPYLPKGQRQVLARELLREKGPTAEED